jgi:hypothetical protein
MKYEEKIKERLVDYKGKNSEMKNLPDSEYNHKGKTYPHILPKICGELNLIETYRNDFLKDKLSKISFHRCFHHLNSSQAMCINFFFPLIKEKKIDFILEELSVKNETINYNSIQFEKESDIDNKAGQRPTNFDFYFETKSGKQFYFEIKYTEDEFGKPSQDKEHKKKYSNIYNKAAENVIKKEYNKEEFFLNNYQLMRNLIHIDTNSYVVFVVPQNNKKVYTQATDANEFVVDEYKCNNVKVLTWENLFQIIDKQNFTGKLKEHFDEFKQKYCL